MSSTWTSDDAEQLDAMTLGDRLRYRHPRSEPAGVVRVDDPERHDGLVAELLDLDVRPRLAPDRQASGVRNRLCRAAIAQTDALEDSCGSSRHRTAEQTHSAFNGFPKR